MLGIAYVRVLGADYILRVTIIVYILVYIRTYRPRLTRSAPNLPRLYLLSFPPVSLIINTKEGRADSYTQIVFRSSHDFQILLHPVIIQRMDTCAGRTRCDLCGLPVHIRRLKPLSVSVCKALRLEPLKEMINRSFEIDQSHFSFVRPGTELGLTLRMCSMAFISSGRGLPATDQR